MWKADGAWPRQREVGDLRWQLDARCREVSDEVSERLVEARRQEDVADLVGSLCSSCPVATACLEAGQEWKAGGTWGGRVLDDGERRKAAS